MDSQRPRRPRRLARGIGIVVVAGLVGLLVYGLTAEPASVSLDEALRRGESLPAPGFDLAALDGQVSGPLAEVVAHVIGVISDAQMSAGIAAARRGSPAGVSEGGDRRPTR